MIKRSIALLLIPVVLLCTTGGVIFVEHCAMSKSPSYSLSTEQECCCSKEVHDLCCNQTTIVIKKTEDHFFTSTFSVIPFEHLSYLVGPVFVPQFNGWVVRLSEQYSQDHAPPDIPVSFTILYRSLLI